MSEPSRTVACNATINAATGEVTYPMTQGVAVGAPCSSGIHPHAGPCTTPARWRA